MIAKTKLLKTATDLLKKVPVPKNLEGIKLADHFRYFIDVDEVPIEDEDAVTSKVMGRPHLPEDFKWPGKHYFYAQLDLAVLEPFDVYDVFPPRGLLSLFLDPMSSDYDPVSTTAMKAFLFDDITSLELRKIPPKEKLAGKGKHYYTDFAKKSRRLELRPAFSLGIDVPKNVTNDLEKALGITYVADPRVTIFGDPFRVEDLEMLFDRDFDYETGTPEQPERVLLFQRDFYDSHLHFWVRRDRKKKNDFSMIEATAGLI